MFSHNNVQLSYLDKPLDIYIYMNVNMGKNVYMCVIINIYENVCAYI